MGLTLRRGTRFDVGDDEVGFFGSKPVSTKEMSGFVKLLVRIVDETPAQISASGSIKPTAYLGNEIIHVPSQPNDIVADKDDRLTVTVSLHHCRHCRSAPPPHLTHPTSPHFVSSKQGEVGS